MNSPELESDLLTLREKVDTGALAWQEARTLLESKMGDRPWASKEWKQKRDARLAKSCRQCGSTTPPLILQHTAKRVLFNKLFVDTRHLHWERWQSWKEEHPIEVDVSSLPLDGRACPKCGSGTIRYFVKEGTWKCLCKTGGVFCHHIFTTPTLVVFYETTHKLEKVAKQQRQDDFDEAYQVGKQTIIRAIDQDIRYLSMEDTVTLCKRCAFVADRTEMVLCEICKAKYHSKRYDRCSKCAGIESKPAIEPAVYIETEEEFDNNSYNQGSLLIMNVLKDEFGITVPMQLLSIEQQKILKEHLRTGTHKDRKPTGRKTPYLLWEYYFEGIVIIDCIKLDNEQFRKAVELHAKPRPNS
jgi:hypothetical protein